MSSSDDEELASLRAQRAARITGSNSQINNHSSLAINRSKYFVDGDDSRPSEPLESKSASPAQPQKSAQPSSIGPPVSIGPPRPPANSSGGWSSVEPEDVRKGSGTATSARGNTTFAGGDRDEEDGDEEEDEVNEETEEGLIAAAAAAEADALRLHFPMSFGSKEKKTAAPQRLHDAFRRAPPAIGPPRPPQRPTSSSTAVATKEDGDVIVGPPRPPPRVGAARAGDAGDTDEDDDDSDDDDHHHNGAVDNLDGSISDDPYALPVTHEAEFGTPHCRAVTCLDLDPACARIATGSLDYKVHLYDFNGMKSDLRAFREIEPHEGHPVLSLSWGPAGDAFLAVTGASQAKIFDRDGRELGEFPRGDMYIRDMRNTKGHVSALTQGLWHPSDSFTALTSSTDGTVRVWDTHHLVQKTVVKPTLARPGRVAVTACTYGMEGRVMAAGVNDGTIQIWSVSGGFGRSAAVGQVAPPSLQMVERQNWTYVSRPNQIARGAHQQGQEITSLAFHVDGVTLASRAADSTLKIWDLRRLGGAPLRVISDLPCAYAATQAVFAPGSRSLVLTGTVHEGASGTDLKAMEGTLAFIDYNTGEVVRRVGMPGAVTAVAWPSRLNQIFVGVGSRRLGSCRVLYDICTSERGVVGAVGKRPRAAAPLDFQPPLVIKTPHALPLFREDPGRKRQRDKDLRDPSKTKRPDLGSSAGVGRQGRLGTTGGTLLTQHLLKKRGKLVSVDEEMDPREAMLRHGDSAERDFGAWTSAYRKTQPVPIFAQEEVEDEDEDEGSDVEVDDNGGRSTGAKDPAPFTRRK